MGVVGGGGGGSHPQPPPPSLWIPHPTIYFDGVTLIPHKEPGNLRTPCEDHPVVLTCLCQDGDNADDGDDHVHIRVQCAACLVH